LLDIEQDTFEMKSVQNEALLGGGGIVGGV